MPEAREPGIKSATVATSTSAEVASAEVASAAPIAPIPVAVAPATAPVAAAAEERSEQKADAAASSRLAPWWTTAGSLWVPRIVLDWVRLPARRRAALIRGRRAFAAGWPEEALPALLTVACIGRIHGCAAWTPELICRGHPLSMCHADERHMRIVRIVSSHQS